MSPTSAREAEAIPPSTNKKKKHAESESNEEGQVGESAKKKKVCYLFSF
jgi:hypothetical protein